MKLKKAKKPTFTYLPTQALPPLSKLQTEWDLARHYYTSDKDVRIEQDIQTTEQQFAAFARKWRKKPFATDPLVLKKALQAYEALSADPAHTRPGRYFWLRSCLDVNDIEAERHLARISQRLRKAGDELLFFSLTLGQVPVRAQKQLLRHPALAHYRYHLQRLFRGALHHLSEPEEKIINLKARQSHSMWVAMTEKIMGNRSITWKRKSMTVPVAIESLSALPSAEKPKLWQLITTELAQIGEVAEHEMNAIVTDARTEDERRGYKKPYSATALSYEDNEQSLEQLVATISKEGFALSRQFYQLKAAYHGVSQLSYSQRNDSAGPETIIPFAQAVDICRDVFYSLKPAYGELFDTMLERGQIDVFPKAGKTGGAFMSDQTGHPIQVMLNHVPNFMSLETLAHEMGHAIHASRSARNTSFYDGHSTITAETASTLFENLVFDAVYAQATSDQQIVMMHDRLMRDVSTIQRQIAIFNAELEIHETIAAQGAMTNSELRDCLAKHFRAYLGKAVSVTPEDGYSYVYIGHLRYGFYVYTYSYGLLMSNIMSNRFRADVSYLNQIDAFLSAGASASVSDIFASIGIDTTKPDTFSEALTPLRQNLQAFRALVKKRQ